MIRILVVDDQPIVRDGIGVILNAQSDMTVVGEAGDGAEAIRRSQQLGPDVVLMDIRMPQMDGIQATRILTSSDSPTPRVLILTTFGEDEYIYAALRLGASGFVLKDAPRQELTAAVRAVAAGDQVLSQSVLCRVVAQYVRRAPRGDDTPPELKQLTAREIEVLRVLALGLNNAEIADRLVVSAATVKTHVANMLAKLGLRDRVQLVVLAYDSGLVEPSP
jgi:DNA-binding NarL/FixJ family response regulator